MNRRKLVTNIIAVLAIVAASRQGVILADKEKAAPASAGIIQPAEGAVLSGIAALQAEVKRSDKKVIVGMVSFYAGETKVADACPGAAAVKWDTRRVPDGSYALTVRVWDYDRQAKKAGKVVHVSRPVTVTVRNCEQ